LRIVRAGGELVGGKYRLERLLGEGGMGAVWIARDVVLDVAVAIKFRKQNDDQDDQTVERFHVEARAAARLRSPHVVHVYDYGADGDEPYIVMEHLSGEDLSERILRRGRLSLAEAATVLNQCAKALVLAHEAGIVHRDLKPRNLFLAQSGGEEVLKVLDFGIAMLAPTPSTNRFTRTGSAVGSPAYMSPEQARGELVDRRSDLWSLGVVLYECLTGTLPFLGNNDHDTVVKICTDSPRSVASLVPELEPGIDAFFDKALARDVAKRFQSIREIVSAFAALWPEDRASFAWVERVSAVPSAAATRDGGQRAVGRDSTTAPVAAAAPAVRDARAEPGKRKFAVGWIAAAVLAVFALAWGVLRPRPSPATSLGAREAPAAASSKGERSSVLTRQQDTDVPRTTVPSAPRHAGAAPMALEPTNESAVHNALQVTSSTPGSRRTPASSSKTPAPKAAPPPVAMDETFGLPLSRAAASSDN
ncbi:MAG TPA: serine/threonine-protein kinase, partial [Polyangiaceae bacterium]